MVVSPPSCSRCLHISGTVLHELGFGCRGESTPWNIFLGVLQAGVGKDLQLGLGFTPFLKKKEKIQLHYQ